MLYTIFDIETTGLSRYNDDICQFAALTVDENLVPVRNQNYYLYHKDMPWSVDAERVHGISQDFLKKYEDQYEHYLRAIYATVQYANLVGHNSDGFDIPFVQEYMYRKGFRDIRPCICYDTMKLWWKPMGRKMKLTALTEQLGYSPDMVRAMTKVMFPGQSDDVSAHNACYDVVCTWLCLKAAVQRGYVSLNNQPKQSGSASLSI